MPFKDLLVHSQGSKLSQAHTRSHGSSCKRKRQPGRTLPAPPTKRRWLNSSGQSKVCQIHSSSSSVKTSKRLTDDSEDWVNAKKRWDRFKDTWVKKRLARTHNYSRIVAVIDRRSDVAMLFVLLFQVWHPQAHPAGPASCHCLAG